MSLGEDRAGLVVVMVWHHKGDDVSMGYGADLAPESARAIGRALLAAADAAEQKGA